MTAEDAVTGRWVDPMGDIDRSPMSESLVTLIAQSCGNDAHVARAQEMLPLLSLQAGESVLEVGCGTGVVARELVRLTSGSMQVSGVDPSALALERAATETATADLGDWADRITYRQMAGQALTFRDNTFDAAMCSRVLIHAADPQDIVAEMVRVVRPGGRIICVEPAHQFWAGVDDVLRDKTSAFTNTDIGRELPGMLRRAGLDDVTVTPHVFIGQALPDLDGIRADVLAGRGMIAAAVRAGRCTMTDVEELCAQAERALRRQTFLFCALHLAVIGYKAA